MNDRVPPKPHAALLFGGTAAARAQWWGIRREQLQCSTSAGCMHPRYRDEGMCLGHLVLRLRDEYREGEFSVRLAMLSERTTTRRLAAWIRERIEEKGWSQGEWCAAVGIAQSSGSRAIRDPDSHGPTFARIAAHWGYTPDGSGGHWRKTTRSKAA